MTTTSTKGRVTGALAIEFATDVALANGDFVHVIGPYKVALADGTKTVVGYVSVRSVKRVIDNFSSTYPVATTTGGAVTVELNGYSIVTRNSGGAFNAGDDVGINASGMIVKVAAGVAKFGVALTSPNAAGVECDILVTGP